MSDEERDDNDEQDLPTAGDLLRWSKETQRKIEFIVNQQAHFQAKAETDMQNIREAQARTEAIEKKIFSDLKDVVKITTSVKTPDPDQLRRINEVVDRLVKEHGYCPVCANELLTYVGTLLSR